MSNFMLDGSERITKTVRLKMNMNLVKQYEELEVEKPTFSYLMNTLLADWLVNQELKQLFKEKGLSE